jgi:hypothetical protein
VQQIWFEFHLSLYLSPAAPLLSVHNPQSALCRRHTHTKARPASPFISSFFHITFFFLLYPLDRSSSNAFVDSTCSNMHTQIGGPVITEDTALSFAAMNGLPGPYIKFFLRELGHEGTCVYTYSLPPTLSQTSTIGLILNTRT